MIGRGSLSRGRGWRDGRSATGLVVRRRPASARDRSALPRRMGPSGAARAAPRAPSADCWWGSPPSPSPSWAWPERALRSSRSEPGISARTSATPPIRPTPPPTVTATRACGATAPSRGPPRTPASRSCRPSPRTSSSAPASTRTIMRTTHSCSSGRTSAGTSTAIRTAAGASLSPVTCWPTRGARGTRSRDGRARSRPPCEPTAPSRTRIRTATACSGHSAGREE